MRMELAAHRADKYIHWENFMKEQQVINAWLKEQLRLHCETRDQMYRSLSGEVSTIIGVIKNLEKFRECTDRDVSDLKVDAEVIRRVCDDVKYLMRSSYPNHLTETSILFEENAVKFIFPILKDLYSCNNSWNDKMNKSEFTNIVNNIDIKEVPVPTKPKPGDFRDLLNCVGLLNEIQSVLDRTNFKDDSNKYIIKKSGASDIDGGTLTDIPKSTVKKCEENKDAKINDCVKDLECKLRNTTIQDEKGKRVEPRCIAASQFRTLQDVDSNDAYYVYELAYSKQFLIYKPRLVKPVRVSPGNIGVFDEYKPDGSRNIIKPTDRCIITWPPFNSDVGRTYNGLSVGFEIFKKSVFIFPLVTVKILEFFD
jgi:hypothetical protein